MNTLLYNKKWMRIIIAGLFSFLLPLSSFLLTSCSEWNDHYENLASQAGNDQTLWQTIQQHPELSDFSDVLSQTKVFKYHKVTDVRSTHNYIDSIVIVNSTIDYNYETVHFRMYI